MKKITALLLCILLLSACSVTAFAENVRIGTDVPESHTVTINVTGDATATLDGEAGTTFTVERLSEPVLIFTPVKGKTIVKITLNGEDITDRLVYGSYTLSPVYEDKVLNIQVETKDFVNDDGNVSPQTGDNSNLPLWIALMALSLMGIVSTLIYGKKKRVFDR